MEINKKNKFKKQIIKIFTKFLISKSSLKTQTIYKIIKNTCKNSKNV